MWSSREREAYEKQQRARMDAMSQMSAEQAKIERNMHARGHVDYPDKENPTDIAFRQMIAQNPSGTDRRHCQNDWCNAMVPQGSDFCVNCQERGWDADQTGLTPDLNRVMTQYERN